MNTKPESHEKAKDEAKVEIIDGPPLTPEELEALTRRIHRKNQEKYPRKLKRKAGVVYNADLPNPT